MYHLSVTSDLWWTKDCRLSTDLFTVFSLLMQNGTSTKINFLGSANKSEELLVHIMLCVHELLMKLVNVIVNKFSRETC